ncbi:LPXTG cell wall anchor domain-containing protein [Specibacter sp. NPDC057265]|uniref:LPXTG cell wall anchor domain-containing protein n=1 Tax=Specibacter sp. NPDC057265 TaxID=3346075 RepID=UPI003635224F
MQASTRAFIKRGGAVCAAAVVLIGGTFTAGAATASPSQDIEPSSISSAVASATSTPSTTDAPLPEGLAEAVERDLDISVEEFNEQGALTFEAGKIQKALTAVDPDAVVSLDGESVKVQTTETAAAETAAGDTKVNIETPAVPATTSAAAVSPANNVDTLLTDYIAEYKDVSNLQSIMINAAGEFVIRTGEPATGGPAIARSAAPVGKTALSDFAAKYGNVKIEAANGPATPYVDVVNGQGYAAIVGDGGGYCSVGWNGFNAEGAPAVITAGHCTSDGAADRAELTDPTTEPAVEGPGGGNLGVLGKFGYSQFGGPGHTPVTGDITDPSSELGNIGTDVAVIDKIEAAVDQFTTVTDWTTQADLKASGPQVTGVSDAIIGAPICKSGRTTGWSCAKVEATGIFLVGGMDNATDPTDVRAVRGFGSTTLAAAPGDSGGSIIAGNLAVGMISAGVPAEAGQPAGPTYGVSLSDALSKTAGYTVKIFLNTPTIATTAPVYREGAITGSVSAPAGSTVLVTVNSVTTEVPVAADGTWTAKAPNKFGTFKVTAVTKNGFSESAAATGSVEVIKETLPVPVIAAPANEGTVAAPVDAITGTGTAGATVAVEISDSDDETKDITGTAVVGANGNWSVAVNPGLAVGNYTATAQQTQLDWNDSPTATNTFAVVYAAPAVVSPANGAEFAFDEGPTEITGTNIAGADVVVTVNGTSYNAVVTDTTWTVTLNNRLGSGTYAVTAVQSLNGVTSLIAESTFTVLAAPQAPAPGGTDMDLANTGASGTTVLLAIAGGLVLLGGAAFLLIRRRGTN